MRLLDRLLSWVEGSMRTWRVARALSRSERGRAIGERVLNSLLGYAGGYGGTAGGWSSDRLELVCHYRSFVYLAVRAIAEEMAGLMPNVAHVTSDGASAHDGHRSIVNAHRRARWEKSLKTILPHEEVDPVGDGHPLMRLFRNPNSADVAWDLWFELVLFLELTGNAYLWCVPNKYGALTGTHTPGELWVIPSHWVWPRKGTGRGQRLIDHYEIRPMVGAGTLKFPPEEVIHLRWKSPVHKIDGHSAQIAGAEFIDASESVNRTRFWQFKNFAAPFGAIELDANYGDPDTQDLDRIYAQFFARLQGESNYGRPIIMPPGAKYTPLQIAPMEMAYVQSIDQLRDLVLAMFKVPKGVLGIEPAGDNISAYAPLRQFCRFTITPKLQYLGQVLTEKLAHRWDSSLRVWWDDPTPDDPEQLNRDITTDHAVGAIVPNEVRSLRGRESYAHGGDDPLLPMGLSPLPLNTGEDLGDIGLTPAEQARYEGSTDEGDVDGAQDHADGTPTPDNPDQPEVEQTEHTADLLATVGGINGALEILAQISAGTISRETGIQMFVLFFGISAEDAAAIIGDTGEGADEAPSALEAEAVSEPDDDGEALSDDEVRQAGKQFMDELLSEWQQEQGLDDEGKKGWRPVNRLAKCGGEGGAPGPCPEGGATPNGGDKPASHAEIHEHAGKAAKGLVQRAKEIPKKLYAAAKNKVASKYKKLEGRYGRKMAVAIMAAGIVGTATPLPGATLVAVAPLIGAAELYLKIKGHKAHISARELAALLRAAQKRGKTAGRRSIIDAPNLLQSDDYDCGRTAFLIACGALGVEPDELALSALGTDAEDGTRPSEILDAIKAAGLRASEITGMEALAESLAAGSPVICCTQTAEGEGHYVVALGLTNKSVVVQDPAEGRKRIGRKLWLSRWHDVDAEGKEYRQYGIALSKLVKRRASRRPSRNGHVKRVPAWW